jgi:cholesterol transport system auxiliary component
VAVAPLYLDRENEVNNTITSLLLTLTFLLSSCTPIKAPVNNSYKLQSYAVHPLSKHKTSLSILVSQPEAVAGYQTEQMLYVLKPYEITSFAHNAWISAPSSMLFPLIAQSLQKTGYFYAVGAGPYVDKTDYRIDTQLIELQQNFIKKPSVIEMTANATLTHIADARVIASRVFKYRIPCPTNTPYGGVLAANQATREFTANLSSFVVREVEQDVGK